jgi:hypothetical protein
MPEVTYKCPACDADLPLGARFCPNCGFVLAENTGIMPPSPSLSYTATRTTTTTATLDDTPSGTGLPESNGHEPSPQSTVVYVQQPPTGREAPSSSMAALVSVICIGLLAVIGVVLWNLGYLGGSQGRTAILGSTQTQPPPNITIQNPPQSPDTNIIVPGNQQNPAPPTNNIIVPPPATTPPATPPPPATNPPATPSGIPPVDVVSVSAQATNTAAALWHYGYTLKLRNNTSKATNVNLRIKFLDADGYVVDDALMNNVFVPANTEQDYEDYKLIDSTLAARVKSVKAELR